MSSYINLLPVILVVLGAMVSIASEPFIRDENKHKVLPWSAAFFVVLAMASCVLLSPDTLYNLFAMDPVRRLLTGAVLLCTLLGISGIQWTLGHEKHKGGEPYGLMLLATGGALLMIQAIDFLALFIAMELTSFPVYALVGLRRRSSNSCEGVFKYFVSGAIFSAIYLYGVAMIYGATGTTSFFASVIYCREPIYAIGVLMVLFGLLFKAGAAPVHYWVADVYTGAAVAVTGFMAAVVKVGALAALGSVWLSVLVTKAGTAPVAWNLAEPVTINSQSESLGVMVIIIALVSMAIGAFSGLAQKSIRRILAFSAVMNAGFILLGILLPDYVGSGKVQRRKRPFVALGVAVCLASLAGLPPVAGFLAKFVLFTGVFSAGMTWIAAAGFGLSLVAAAYYLRVAYVLFAPAKNSCECECQCKCAENAVFGYMLKFTVTAAAVALLVVGVLPGLALL